MTERLYYTDPTLARFDARVLRLEPLEGGRRAAILDRTAFYPTSGGQPFDTGTLGTARVVDVIDRDDGEILHAVEGDLEPGSVSGEVDWPRRFDHMQQHTGQHVLSAAFDRCCSARTVSFHLGAESSTIDLSREVTPDEIARAESEANRIVWEDRPVHIRFADAEEAARLPLRKEPVRTGRLRLIEVEDFDLSACGGTHVPRTGSIGVIAVAGSERFRGGSRIEFLCGGRALAGFRDLRRAVTGSVRLLSVLPAELPAAIERLQAEGRDLKRRLKDLQNDLAVHEAADLAARAETHGTIRLAAGSFGGRDVQALKALASAVAMRPGHLAALLSEPPPASIVIARGSGVPVDCAGLLKDVTTAFGGRGGGRPELAQGGGIQGPAGEVLRFIRSRLTPT